MQIINQVKALGYEIASFLYEIPLQALASLVAGIAFGIMAYTSISLSFFAYGASFLFSKLCIVILSKFKPTAWLSLPSILNTFYKGYGTVRYLLLAACAITILIYPALGIAVAGCVGICEGLLSEIETHRMKQNLNRYSHPVAGPRSRAIWI